MQEVATAAERVGTTTALRKRGDAAAAAAASTSKKKISTLRRALVRHKLQEERGPSPQINVGGHEGSSPSASIPDGSPPGELLHHHAKEAPRSRPEDRFALAVSIALATRRAG